MFLKTTNITGHLALKGKLNIRRLALKYPQFKHTTKRVSKRKKEVKLNEKPTVHRERTAKTSYKECVQRGFDSIVLKIPTSEKTVTALCYPSGKLLFMGANSMDLLEEATIIACSLN